MLDTIFACMVFLLFFIIIAGMIYGRISSPFPFALLIPEEMYHRFIEVDQTLRFHISILDGSKISITDKNGFSLCVYHDGWKFKGGKELKKDIKRKIRKHIADYKKNKIRIEKDIEKRQVEEWNRITNKVKGN